MVQNKVKTLGLWLSIDPKLTFSINYEEKLQKIKNCLNTWELRRLTLLGKITVLKSLVVSLLVYIFSPLKTNQTAIEEINKLFYQFLWNGKRDKIKRNILINDYPNGGLRMLDIAYFNKALKITWIKKYLDNENQGKWKIFLNRELKNQGNELILISNLSKKDMAKCLNISDPFWKEICETWVEINYENKIASTKQFQSQYLWLNSLIRIGNQPVHYKNWVDKGILKIKHIMKNSSQFLTHDELQNKYDLKVCPLAYCGIITAIKKNESKNSS